MKEDWLGYGILIGLCLGLNKNESIIYITITLAINTIIYSLILYGYNKLRKR